MLVNKALPRISTFLYYCQLELLNCGKYSLQALFDNSFIIRLPPHCFSIRKFLIRIRSSAAIIVILGKIFSKHAEVGG